MSRPPPYASEEQVKQLVANDDQAALKELRSKYLAYLQENRCIPFAKESDDDPGGWGGLGEYFLKLARSGTAHGMTQTREEFIEATKEWLEVVPAWIKKVEYVQTVDVDTDTYFLSLPPKVLAEQAYIHARNPQAADADYMPPPIYNGFIPQITPEPRAVQILNSRICDYTISHCA
jgi:hypothetical protein